MNSAFASPVGPYFKSGIRPVSLKVSPFDRAAPHGTGHVKAGLNYAMSLYSGALAHAEGYDENLYLDAATRTCVEETGRSKFHFRYEGREIRHACLSYHSALHYPTVPCLCSRALPRHARRRTSRPVQGSSFFFRMWSLWHCRRPYSRGKDCRRGKRNSLFFLRNAHKAEKDAHGDTVERDGRTGKLDI